MEKKGVFIIKLELYIFLFLKIPPFIDIGLLLKK